MTVSRALAVLAVAGTLGFAGAAKAQLFDCAIDAGESQYFITKRYIFDYDPAKGRVRVLDAVTKEFTGGAVPGKVTADTPSRTTFSWSVKIKNTIGQEARMLYTGAYIKASRLAIITAKVGGGDYVGAWDARGTCTLK